MYYSLFIVCIIQKGILSDTVIRYLELPALFFEPDEKYHEDWYTLHDDIVSTQRGHKFVDFKMESTQFCYKCKKMIWNGDSSIFIPVVQCSCCHLISHPECCELIETNCSFISSLRLGYVYTNEPIFVNDSSYSVY